MFNEMLNRTDASMHVENEIVQRRAKENAQFSVTERHSTCMRGMTKYAFNIARDVIIHYTAQRYLEYYIFASRYSAAIVSTAIASRS